MRLEDDAGKMGKVSIEEDNYRKIGESMRPRIYDFVERMFITLGSHALSLHFNDFLIPEHESRVRKYFSYLDIKRGKRIIENYELHHSPK